MSKDKENRLSRGIFWVIAEMENDIKPENIFAIRKPCNQNGEYENNEGFSSKDGTAQNHKVTWATLGRDITKGKSFDYYPRGRVEIVRNKATIWMNGNILPLADEIKKLFSLLNVAVVQVKEDGSKHYHCHFD